MHHHTRCHIIVTSFIEQELMSINTALPKVLPNKQSVVVIDVGIKNDIPNLLYAYDFYGMDADARNSNIHGSLVASQVNTADPDSQIVLLKISPDGSSDIDSLAIHRALAWVVQNATQLNVASVNLSIGTTPTSQPGATSSYTHYFSQLKALGVATVVAAGNDGLKDALSLFGAGDDTIAVSASDGLRNFISSSNRDADLTDLVADGYKVPYQGQLYSGTSLAAPLVAGAIAELQAHFFDRYSRELTVDEVLRLLQSSADPMKTTAETAGNSPGEDTGYVQLNLNRAIQTISSREALASIGITVPAQIATISADNELAGQLYRLYYSAFERAPDLKGMGLWLYALENGLSLKSAAAQFIASEEFVARYSNAVTNEDFVDLLYQNTLFRNPDEAGLRNWTAALDMGLKSRSEVLVNFSESPECQRNLAELIGTQIKYEPVG